MASIKRLIGIGVEPTQAAVLDAGFMASADCETIAATGSVQADAAVLSSDKLFATVTGADGVKGVKIPTNERIGTLRFIRNPTAAVLYLWPPTGGQISLIGVNNGLNTISGPRTITCLCTAANTWIAG